MAPPVVAGVFVIAAGVFLVTGGGLGRSFGPIGATDADGEVDLPSAQAVPRERAPSADPSEDAGANATGDQPRGDAGPDHVTCHIDGCAVWRTAGTDINAFVVPTLTESGLLIVLGEGGSMMALDVADGSERWQVEGPVSPHGLAADPIVAGDLIVYADPAGQVAARSVDDGALVWTTDLTADPVADVYGAALVGDTLLVDVMAAPDGALAEDPPEGVLALDVDTGSLRWARSADVAVVTSAGAVVRLPSEEALDTSVEPVPAIDDEDGVLVGLAVEDGAELWRVPVGVGASFETVGPHVVLQEWQDAQVLSVENGTQLAQFDETELMWTNPGPTDGGEVIWSMEGMVAAAAADGSMWSVQLRDCCAGVAAFGAEVLLTMNDGSTVALDRATGAERARWTPEVVVDEFSTWRFGGFFMHYATSDGHEGQPDSEIVRLFDGASGQLIAEFPATQAILAVTDDGGVVVAGADEVVRIRPAGSGAPHTP